MASICQGAVETRDLRRAVLDVLRTRISFDAHVWLLTDPQTSVGWSPLAEVPCPTELPELIRLRYLTDGRRWTSLTPGVPVALSTDDVPRGPGDLQWRDFLGGYGVRDVATIVFADRQGCWGFLDLWRGSGDFRTDELAPLALALGPVTAGLRRCLRSGFEGLAGSAEALDPAVLLLSPDLEVRRQTPAVESQLRSLLPTPEDRAPVPASAYNVAAQLLAAEAGVDGHRASARVALLPGRWLTFRASRLAPVSAEADIAVTIEPTGALDRLSLYSRVNDLTDREAEVLRCLAHGADTRTVATSLHLSEFTVQDHLKAIFTKTGVRSRRALLARAVV